MDKVLSKVRRAGLVLTLALVMTVAAFATGGESATPTTAGVDSIANQVVSGLSGMVPTILTAIGVVAVAGLTIFGARFALKHGLKLFKTVTNG